MASKQTGGVKRTEQLCDLPLSSELPTSNFYQEMVIENRTGRSLYVLSGGKIECVPSTSFASANPSVLIKVLVRNVQLSNAYGVQQNLTDPRGRVKTTYTVEMDQLARGPVFIRELGMSMSLYLDTDALKAANPYSIENFDIQLRKRVLADFDNGRSVGVYFYINSHDQSFNTMYTEVNGQLLGFKVNHYPEQEEVFTITTRRESRLADDSLTTFIVSPELWAGEGKHKIFTVEIRGQEWIFGSSKDAVIDRMTKRREEVDSRYTRKELETQIDLALANKDKEVNALKEKIEALTKELDLKKHEISNLKNELDQNDAQVKRTTTERLARLNVRVAEQNAETAAIKAEAEQQMLREKQIQERIKSELEREKREADRQAMEQKLRSERLSASADQWNSAAGFAKATAGIITVLASLIALAVSMKGNGKLTSGLLKCTPLAISWGHSILPSFATVSKGIQLAKSVMEPVLASAKAFGNTIRDKLEDFGSKVKETVRETITTVKDKVTTLFSNLSSGLYTLFN